MSEFRDVYEVNGQATRDRDERLSRLFLSRSTAASAQMQSITKRERSLQYRLDRTFRSTRRHSRCCSSTTPTKDGSRSKRVADTMPLLEFDGSWPPAVQLWVVQYQEVNYRTLIRGKGNRDLPIHGRFWVEPTTGAGRRQRARCQRFRGRSDRRCSIRLRRRGRPRSFPVEMRESYGDVYGTRVDGVATYSNFRQFKVEVEELVPPDEDDPQDRD